MARGMTSSPDSTPNGSLAFVSAKGEKIKAGNKSKGKQRAHAEEEDEEEEDEEVAGSPRGAKRSRVNEDGDSRPANRGEYKRVKTLPRDVDG
jgi:hypothetical protein